MTSITKIGGVMIVTQVIPQDQSSIQLQSAAAPPQAPPTAPEAPPMVMYAPPPPVQTPPIVPATKMDDVTAAFLQGQPHGLGVVQIFIGVLTVLFSLTAVFSPILMLHAPLCLAVTFIISGSMVLVAATKQTTVPLVLATLVWNMISAVVGLVGVAYVSWLLAASFPSEQLCNTKTSSEFVLPYKEKMERCVSRLWMLDVSVYGPLGLLLVLLVLQVCVAVTVCVFSGKAIRRRAPIMVEAGDDSRLLCPAAPQYDGDDALLDGSEETSPPNSP